MAWTQPAGAEMCISREGAKGKDMAGQAPHPQDRLADSSLEGRALSMTGCDSLHLNPTNAGTTRKRHTAEPETGFPPGTRTSEAEGC